MSRPDLHERAEALRRDRVPFVHARVVRAVKPTSAKPGDEGIIRADGTIEGFIGGTCAETTVRAQSLALLDSGEPLLLRITPSEEEAASRPDEPGVVTALNPCLSGGTLEIFLEPIIPTPLVAVKGETPIAQAVLDVAGSAGYHAAPYTEKVCDEAAAVVVAFHGRDEEETLTAALNAGVPYVALVASRRRGSAIIASLPVSEEDRARVRTPAGLDIGARTPGEIAVSILAEIVALRRKPARADGPSTAGASGPANAARPAESPRPEEPGGTPEPERPVGTAIDPVCGMSVAMVDSSLHLDHDGRRVWFCAPGCRKVFAANPSAYALSS